MPCPRGHGCDREHVWACEAARERSLVIAVDEVHEGLTLPRGSKLIYRDGFVKGCRAKDRFCLSQIVLSKDAQLCGLNVPKQATVYLNYTRSAFEHYQPVMGKGQPFGRIAPFARVDLSI